MNFAKRIYFVIGLSLLLVACGKTADDSEAVSQSIVGEASTNISDLDTDNYEGEIEEDDISNDAEEISEDETESLQTDNSEDKDDNLEFINGTKRISTTGVDDTDNFYGLEFTKDSDIFSRIKGVSYKDNCPIPLSDLRYLHVLHIGFDGQTHEGELICNKKIAEDLLEIFEDLYQANYQIEKIRLIDEYGADDEASMEDNNSSCFNFRYISHTNKISKHGYGLAVDINTLYNPYVKTVDGNLYIEPNNATSYVDRTADFLHKIDESDLAYQLFTAHGFSWGGSWNSSKDYQHFEMDN